MSEIALHRLGKTYGGTVAVDDVTLTIRSGEFVTLLGPSGSGKTTTLRMIAGLERPTTGTVHIGDRCVSGDGVFVPVHKRRLGMVFQSYAVWPHKTVLQNVAFPLQRQGRSRAEQDTRAERILDLVELSGYAGRYPSQLSGGQQQRVALARALVGEPDVILFDEPLSNLDAQLRDSMRVLVRDLHRKLGLTAVYVTHDQSEAMLLADRIFVMRDGKLVQGGTPAELFEAPKSRFVAEFVGSANVFPVRSVDAAAGMARLAAGATLCVSGDVGEAAESVVVVRPHRIRLATPADTENVLVATVGAVAYLGDRLRITATVPDCGNLVIDAVPGTMMHPAEGQAIRIALPRDACRVV